jgi:phosphate acetyltransferase
MEILASIRERAKKLNKRVVLPEGHDPRTILAAYELKKEKITSPIVLGDKTAVLELARKNNVSFDGIEIVTPASSPDLDEYVNFLYEMRKHKGVTLEQAKTMLLSNTLFFAAAMLRKGKVDASIGGAANSTANVLRAAIYIVGTAPGLKTVSGAFLMVVPDGDKERILVFGDSGVVPNPTDEQLADIAIASARTFKLLVGEDPIVGLLSFSTKGSAQHESIDKVRRTLELLKQRKVDFPVDGELQADAALVPSVAKIKAPNSQVAGHANVLIFPDLNAGNIGYKLVERLAKARAIGTILQGLAGQAHDLSRGCSAPDIADMAATAIILSESK